MGSHLCTTDSLRAGLEDIPPMECPLCGHVTLLALWCDAWCKTCGCSIESGPGPSINSARHKTGMTRKQWAELMGVSPKTVSNYDFWPSQSYIDKCRKFFRDYFGPAHNQLGE